MRAAHVVTVVSVFLGLPARSQSGETLQPNGNTRAVIVNSQKSLADVVGDGFRDKAWEYPAGLLPRVFPDLTYISGPGDQGLLGKAAWRKPVPPEGRDLRRRSLRQLLPSA